MPLIRYQCSDEACGAPTKVLYTSTANGVAPTTPCKVCGKDSKRVFSAPNSVSKITIDNGTQARAVETYPDIMELREDRIKGPNRGD